MRLSFRLFKTNTYFIIGEKKISEVKKLLYTFCIQWDSKDFGIKEV